jgi:hypothetical protein
MTFQSRPFSEMHIVLISRPTQPRMLFHTLSRLRSSIVSFAPGFACSWK